MKDYKVGDEVLVKGKVYGIDDDSGSYSYLVDFDKPFGTSPSHYWVRNNYIADEEPVKPVLPKDVAEELECCKHKGFTFDGLMPALFGKANAGLDTTWDFFINNDNAIEALLNAWNNGYTVEKEPVSLVKVPGRLNRTTYYAIKDGGLAFGYLDKDKQQIRDYSAHKFTDEEINKFDLQDCEKELVADDSED